MSFSQLPAVKKDTKNCAPGKFFGPSYFVTALGPKTSERQRASRGAVNPVTHSIFAILVCGSLGK